MKRVGWIAILSVVIAMTPALTRAQAGQAAGAAAKAVVQTAPPTGPMAAITKAATAIREARAAAAASRGAATTAAGSSANHITAVTGYLWTANNSPITNATVQLRNVTTGQVELYTKTNGVGEFLFSDVKGGSYVIEYVNTAGETATAGAAGAAQSAASTAANNAAGSVMAVGSPFSVAPGETVATFVRTLNNVTLFVPDLATNVATTAVQTAANAGVTAVVTPLAPDAPPAESTLK